MRVLRAGVLAGLCALPVAALAQTDAMTEAPPPLSSVVTIDQEQIFSGTAYGQALQAAFEAETNALIAENRKIDAALEAEERDLTDQRSRMEAEAFRPLAEAFDTKANELRNAQEVKSRDLARRQDEDRRLFFQTVAPILGDYMVERGAVVILDKAAIVVSLGSIDITKEVIARIDARLGDGPIQP